MNVVVVGAGIVGLTSALALARAGHKVFLIDRRREVAAEASHANAGWLGPHMPDWMFEPVRARQLINSFWRVSGPLSWRPRLDWSQSRWMWYFRKFRSPELAVLHQSRLSRLLHYSQNLQTEWQSADGLDIESSTGTLQLIRQEAEWERWNMHVVSPLADRSVAQLLDVSALRVAEPAISVVPKVLGAVRWTKDSVANCALAARHLKSQCEAAGVVFRPREVVRALLVEGGRVVGIASENGPWRSEAVVLCAGMDSIQLARQIRQKLPLEAVHGFTATVNLAADARGLSHAVFDPGSLLSFTPFGGRLRVSGGFQLDSRGSGLNPRAVQHLMNVASEWLPGAARYSDASYWNSHRVMSPDGVPLVGRAKLPGLWLNVGHGQWGFASAWGCAQLVADQVSERAPAISTDGLTPDRF